MFSRVVETVGFLFGAILSFALMNKRSTIQDIAKQWFEVFFNQIKFSYSHYPAQSISWAAGKALAALTPWRCGDNIGEVGNDSS